MRELCFQEDDSISTVSRCRKHSPLGVCGNPINVSIASLIEEKIRSKTFFLSIELIPGTTHQLQGLLDESLAKISELKPLFASVTWREEHLKFTKSGDEIEVHHPAIDLCKLLQNLYKIPALMHLSAGNLKPSEIRTILKVCLTSGVRNILALRGDERNERQPHIPHASDLVHLIKTEFGSEIIIGVAGYPSAHPEAKSLHEDLLWLKEKVDAGAEYILTQIVTSFDELYSYSKHCIDLGINVPILPGLFLIQSYENFEKVIKACHVKVPLTIYKEIKELKDQTKEREYGEHLLQDILHRLVTTACCPGIHFFTMNRVSTVLELCKGFNEFKR